MDEVSEQLINKLLPVVLNQSFQYHLGFELRSDMDPYWRPVAIPERRMIVMNLNWHKPRQIVAQAAHELGHLVNGDVGREYHVSFTSADKSEIAANRFAFNLLIPEIYKDTLKEQASVNKIINLFELPLGSESLIYEELSIYYSNE